MRVTSLASGSSGNCYLVETETTAVLIDAGISLRRLEGALRRLGVAPDRLSGILLTHEHSDHIRGAPDLSTRYGVPVYANRATLQAGRRYLEGVSLVELPPDTSHGLGDLNLIAFRVRHDAADTVGYALEADGVTVTLATDLGAADDRVRAMVGTADLAIVEANHDPDLLDRGPYPRHLKRRILGSHGHLSNQAAAELALAAARGRARMVWLAHLSQVNNRPALALAAVAQRLAEEGATHLAPLVAARDRPSLVWESGGAGIQQQLRLPW